MGRKKSVDANTMAEWLDVFNNSIVPFMCENNLSLHEAFDLLRERNDNGFLYDALSGLWHTDCGKEYI